MSNNDFSIQGIVNLNLQNADQQLKQWLSQNQGIKINIDMQMGGGAGGAASPAGGFSAAGPVAASAAPARGRSAARTPTPLAQPVYGATGYSTSAHRYFMQGATPVLQPGFTQDASGAFRNAAGQFASAATAMAPQQYHQYMNEQAQQRAQKQIDRAQKQADDSIKRADRAMRMAQASGYTGSDPDEADEFMFQQRVDARAASMSRAATRRAGEPAWRAFMRRSVPGAYAMMTGEPGAVGTFMGNFASSAMMPIGDYMSSQFQMMTQQRLEGRVDPMMGSATTWGLVGGLLGAGVGSLFGGMGGFMGGWTGSSAGQMLGQWIAAGETRKSRMATALMPTAALSMPDNRIDLVPGEIKIGVSGRPVFRDPAILNNIYDTAAGKGRLFEKWQDDIRSLYGGKFRRREDLEAATPTATEMAETYGSLYEAMLTGGHDPNAPRSGKFIRTWQRYEPSSSGSALSSIYGYDISGRGGPVGSTDPHVLTVMRNAYLRWMVGANQVIQKDIAPIFAGETSFNPIDLTAKYGPVSAQRFVEAETSLGDQPRTTIDMMRRATYSLRATEETVTRANLQFRGRGRATESALTSAMQSLKDTFQDDYLVESSKTYQSLRKSAAAATTQREREDDLGYNIRAIDLAAKQQTIQNLPYMPGSTMRVAVETMQNNAAQLKTLRKRYKEHMTGVAPPYEEGQQEQAFLSIRQLEVSQSAAMATLTEGVENRIMAMSAGRPAFFSRMDSNQMAALFFQQRGLPTRAYGARGGTGLARQNRFIEGLMGGTTSAADAMNPSQMSDNGNLAAAMSRLGGSMEKFSQNMEKWMNSKLGSGGGNVEPSLRPTEARGRDGARQKSQDTDARWQQMDRGN